VDLHTELFTRNDGMLQSGPDPIAEEILRRRAIGETIGANADSTRDVSFSKKLQSSN
jgi:hypothetical protein